MLPTTISSVFVTYVALTSYVNCTDIFHNLIVKGIPARTQQFPFIISIQKKSSGHHLCGGSLIQWDYVLTAAHCVVYPNNDASSYFTYKPHNYQIMAGDLSISKYGAPTRRVRQPIKLYPHPDYIPRIFINDIALIRVYPRFLDSSQINLIPLSMTTPETKQQCEIVGWGVTAAHTHESASPVLRTAVVEIKSISFCQSSRSYDGTVPKYTVCAGAVGDVDLNTINVEDACQGDSGGPLKCDQFLCGIVSFGIGCGKAKYPGIYTDVSKFRTWINMTITNRAHLKRTFKLHWCVLIILLNFVHAIKTI